MKKKPTYAKVQMKQKSTGKTMDKILKITNMNRYIQALNIW